MKTPEQYLEDAKRLKTRLEFEAKEWQQPIIKIYGTYESKTFDELTLGILRIAKMNDNYMIYKNDSIVCSKEIPTKCVFTLDEVMQAVSEFRVIRSC